MSEVVTHVDGRAHRPPRHGPRPLTPRERQILALVAQGAQQKAIARALGITPETVKEHLTHAYEALDALNAPHAVHLAHERGLLGDRRAWQLGEW